MRLLLLLLFVLSAVCGAVLAVNLVPCQLCIDSDCPLTSYVDYNADGIGARCAGARASELYDCYMRNPLRVCIHSTLNATTPTSVGPLDSITHKIKDVAPFVVEPVTGFTTTVIGTISVERPVSTHEREIVLHLVDLHTKHFANEIRSIKGNPGEIVTIDYAIEFWNKGPKTDLFLFVFVHDIVVASKQHVIYAINGASPDADNCTEELRANYNADFSEQCFPQTADITAQTRLKYEYTLTSRGRIAELYLTQIPPVAPMYSVEHSTKKYNMLTGIISGAIFVVFLSSYCYNQGKRPYWDVTTDAQFADFARLALSF